LRHHHDADVNINVNIPTQDLERLIDKGTDAAITIITALTVAHLLKGMFTPRSV
jgi:hypothetical protein